jgi:carboxylesterase type B
MHKLIALTSVLGLCISICGSTQNIESVTSATVLFYNDGDWRTHEQTPSALLVNKIATYDVAVEACASYGEKLLDCGQFGDFANVLAYYQYQLQNLNDGEESLLWSSCNQTYPVDFQGTVVTAKTSHIGIVNANANVSNALEFPFLCTNTAPFVKQVDTNYSSFPRVQTPSTIDGVSFEGLRDHMAYRFLGIPFAAPPVGDLRFEYSQPLLSAKKTVVNATQYGPACLQVGDFEGNSMGLNPWGNSEDCLYLQVFTPTLPIGKVPSQGLKPVMFWIHGGGLSSGTGSDSTFDGDSLVSRGDVVLVTINYRLNIFGFLSLDDGVITGNYGLSDQISALQWVQKYIAAFGGDPDNVTVFGQSAGGASVMNLIASPTARGLFKNAIPQSLDGNVVDQSSIATAMSPYLEPVCSTGLSLDCLQQVSVETLLDISEDYWGWSTVIDDVYIFDQPVSLVSEGDVNSVNVLMGFMPDEAQSLLATSITPNMTNFASALEILIEEGAINSSQSTAIASSNLWDVPEYYTDVYNATVNIGTDGFVICHVEEFFAAASSSNSTAFSSLWTYTHQRAYALSYYSYYDLCTFPVGQPYTPYYRCHSGDLYQVFGTYYIFDQPVRVEEDIYYTNAVQDIWTAFAKTGNPNPDKEYLKVRGYNSTLELFGGFTFEQFSDNQVANLQWPRPWYADLPDLEHCRLLGITF